MSQKTIAEIKQNATYELVKALGPSIADVVNAAFNAGRDEFFVDSCRLELVVLNCDNDKMTDSMFRDFVRTIADDLRERRGLVKK